MALFLGPGRGSMQQPAKFGLQWRWVLLGCLIISLSSCVMLSNREYTREAAAARGVIRVGIFLERWPHFLAKTDQNSLGSDFITDHTIFFGPWKPAENINPHAMDILDITDEDVARKLMDALIDRGYEPHLISELPGAEQKTVQSLMESHLQSNKEVDGFLFCYYAPTLFVTGTNFLPAGGKHQSIGLSELSQSLHPGAGDFIWSGQRLAKAPPQTITHAFIYVNLTLFNARDWQPLWMVADSRVGGKIRPSITECPPGPTERDYWTDPAMVERIMLRNLRCRLWHLLPDAF